MLPELEAAVISIGAALEIAEIACGTDPVDRHVDFMETYTRPVPTPAYEQPTVNSDHSLTAISTSSYDQWYGEYSSATTPSLSLATSFVTSVPHTVEVLLVGGGGSGSHGMGGGGGAGGVFHGIGNIPAGTYSLVIGLGGVALTEAQGTGWEVNIGTSGGHTILAQESVGDIATAFGGLAAGIFTPATTSYGSGGGGDAKEGGNTSGVAAGDIASYTSVWETVNKYGNDGSDALNKCGGGGGGAGSAGDLPDTSSIPGSAGPGGTGTLWDGAYLAAGGGGGGYQDVTVVASGGSGIGGNGGTNTKYPTNPVQHTGSGGGGGGQFHYDPYHVAGTNGAHGCFYIRFFKS